MADNDINIKIRLTQFQKLFSVPLGKVQSGLSKFGNKLSSIAKTAKKMALPIAAVGAAIGVIGAASLKAAGAFEQQRVAFETMLGSAKEADRLLRQIEDFSASTPFQLPGLIEGSKRLLAFGVAAEDVVATMGRLGDLAQGNQESLNRLTDAFGKLRAKGKASLEEINRFTEAGVPLVDELAKNYGVTTEEILKLVSKGKVGFKEVEDAVVSLTSEGGKFFNLTNKQAQTFNGLFSTMKDNIGLVAKDIGELLLPAAKKIVKFITDITKAVREFIQERVNLNKSLNTEIEKQEEEILKITQERLKKEIKALDEKIVKADKLVNEAYMKELDGKEILGQRLFDLIKEQGELENQLKEAQEQEKTVIEKKAQEKRLADKKRRDKAAAEAEAALNKQRAENFKTFNDYLVQATTSKNKEVAAIAKALAIYDIALKSREAAVSAYSSLAGIPIIGPALGIAAAAAAIAFGAEQANAISQQSPGFKDGGIVPGNSFNGDRVPVRVNSGEAILNQQQQKRLLDIANGNSGGSGGGDLTVILRTENRVIAETVVEGYNTGRNLDLVTKITNK